MIRIEIDDILRQRLGNLAKPVQICDASGRVLAHVLPVDDMADFELVSPDVSDEELERRHRSNERRYTTAEVLDHLERL